MFGIERREQKARRYLRHNPCPAGFLRGTFIGVLFATSGTPTVGVSFTPTPNSFRKSTEMSRVLHTCISHVLIDTFTGRKSAILGTFVDQTVLSPLVL
jgi:hypothetical protein